MLPFALVGWVLGVGLAAIAATLFLAFSYLAFITLMIISFFRFCCCRFGKKESQNKHIDIVPPRDPRFIDDTSLESLINYAHN